MRTLALALMVTLAACGGEQVTSSAYSAPPPMKPAAITPSIAKPAPAYLASDFVASAANRDPFEPMRDDATAPVDVPVQPRCSSRNTRSTS
jgi:hypothetical protein